LPTVARPTTSRTGRNGAIQVHSDSDLEYKRQLLIWLARFPETDKISPPLLQANDVTFGYSADKIILRHVNFDVGLDSRIAMVGANGAGKSTL